MSWFNTDTLCLDCQGYEETHPLYGYAKDRELEEVMAGNTNFPGIGLPLDFYERGTV